MRITITHDDDISAAAALGCVIGSIERMRCDGIEWSGHSIILSSMEHVIIYDKTRAGNATFRVSTNQSWHQEQTK